MLASQQASMNQPTWMQVAFSGTGEKLARLRSELAVWRQRCKRLTALYVCACLQDKLGRGTCMLPAGCCWYLGMRWLMVCMLPCACHAGPLETGSSF